MGRKSLAEERRKQIIYALNRCISKYGLQKTSIKKIAQEAGVQPGILHHYFKDRDEIIEEMVTTIVHEVAAKYLEEIRRYDEPEERFERTIDFLFGPEMMNGEYASFFYECWAEAKRNPRVRESFRMLYDRFRRGIVDMLAEQKSAEISPTDIEELAHMVIAIQDGISLQWDMWPGELSRASISQMTKKMIRIYLNELTRIPANDPEAETGKFPVRL